MVHSRIKSSGLNLASGLFNKAIFVVCSFVVRTVFVYTLGKDYLGIGGLYSSILAMLSLTELGFGKAMAYSMYKPLAEKDYHKLTQLIGLYRKVYTIIGGVVLVFGLALVPFLDVIIKNKPNIPHLTLYYLLYLGQSVLSYLFFAYRSSVLNADQRSYVITNYHSFFEIVRVISQILVLLFFRNFTIYLIISIGCTILFNICIAIRATKDYPIFGRNVDDELSKVEKHKIFNDTKALLLQNISYKVLNSTDTILISSFVGLEWVGLIAIYNTLEGHVSGLLNQLTTSVHASLGNFFAVEDKERGYLLFKRIEFINFLFYGFSAILLIVLSTPFVTLWVGKDYTMSETIVISLIIRFLIEGYMNVMSMFRNSLGLFVQGKWLPLGAAALNIALSIFLSYPLGAAGIIIATPITRLVINVWYMPLIICHRGFNKPVKPFYFDYCKRYFVIVIICILMIYVKHSLLKSSINWNLFLELSVVVSCSSFILFWLAFRRRDEVKFLAGLIRKHLANRCLS